MDKLDLIKGIKEALDKHNERTNKAIQDGNENFNEEDFLKEIAKIDKLCVQEIRNVMLYYGPVYQELYKA